MLESGKGPPLLVSLEKIWDLAPHAAFTSLLKWQGQWYCIFRESDSHYGGNNGTLRLLHSQNGIIWNSQISLELEGWDLRDPKLSIMPDGRWMLLAGASRFNKEKVRVAHQSMVSFSADGKEWTPFFPILFEEWLWHITWFQGVGYGIAYFFSDRSDPKSKRDIRLYKTVDGVNYRGMTTFSVPGWPSEATLRFFPNGQMVALLRRDGREEDHAWIGSSFPPYEDWLWAEAHLHLGGPNFLILPNGAMWAAGRILIKSPYGLIEKMALASMDLNNLYPELILDSGGDCSYPGMVYEAPYLYLSYYSSHEWSTAIYFAKVLLE